MHFFQTLNFLQSFFLGVDEHILRIWGQILVTDASFEFTFNLLLHVGHALDFDKLVDNLDFLEGLNRLLRFRWQSL